MVLRSRPEDFFKETAASDNTDILPISPQVAITPTNSNNNTILVPQNSTINYIDNKVALIILGLGVLGLLAYLLLKEK